MKPLKPRSIIIAATAVLAVAVAAAIVAVNVKKQTQQDTADTAPDAFQIQTSLPALTVGGKANPDVYLQSLDIQIEVTGGAASTRYTMVFKNKTHRVQEGALTFPLPDGRGAAHYALDVDGRMRDGVPIGKTAGTEVFEEIERRRVDPGLLEQVEGGSLRTRVYPIPAYGSRTVSVGYFEELPLENGLLRYRLPTAYPDTLEKFSVRAAVWKGGPKPLAPKSGNGIRFDMAGENYAASFVRYNYRPGNALDFALPAPADAPQAIMQPTLRGSGSPPPAPDSEIRKDGSPPPAPDNEKNSYYFIASAAPKIEPRKKIWADDLAVIWDVSLSGARRDLRRETEMLDVIFAEKKNADVHLYLLNNELVKGGEYKVGGGDWGALKKVLEAAVFDGGTDFSKITLDDIAGGEILFFSDGVSTLSGADFLKGKDMEKPRPIHCVVSSPNADYGAMKSIARGTGGKYLNISALPPDILRGELLNETLMFLGAEHGGAVREVCPSAPAPVLGNFSIAGIADTNYAEVTLLFGFGGKAEKRIRVVLDAESAAGGGDGGNAHKIWAQKKIAELDFDREKNRAGIAELGRRFGMVTRYTSLVVLETVDDYIRYRVEPPESETELLERYNFWVNGGKPPVARPVGRWANGGWQLFDRDSARRTSGGLGSIARPPSGVLSRSASGIMYGLGYGAGYGAEMMEEAPAAKLNSESFGGHPAASRPALSNGLCGQNVKPTNDTSKNSVGFDVKTYRPHKKLGRARPAGAGRPPKEFEFDFDFGASIHRVVKRNQTALQYAYDRRLREKPELDGRVTVKFSIDESGKVISVQVLESTLNDRELESTIIERVKSWRFEKPADTSGGVTEAVYPFVFWKGKDVGQVTIDASQPTGAGAAERAKFLPQSKIGVTPDGAAAAAADLRRWRGADFSTPRRKPEYPAAQDETFRGAEAGKSDEYNMNSLTGNAAYDYKIYLENRKTFGGDPACYFNMADWFYKHGGRETALRVLTSIADLELENAALYRLLGYRFKEYGEYALERFVCGKVTEWRPMEPQGYRDYALSLADNGDAQGALDSLCSLLEKPYSADMANRSRGIEEVIVTEINHLIAKNPGLDKSKVDRRLLADAAADIRVVINWNADNTDIDLHVVDPSGEECFYGRRQTGAGGRLSADITTGYGPEQFILKKAAKGKYRVYASYYGGRRFTPPGPSTVMAEVYKNYAGKNETRETACLQISKAKGRGGRVKVLEFEF